MKEKSKEPRHQETTLNVLPVLHSDLDEIIDADSDSHSSDYTNNPKLLKIQKYAEWKRKKMEKKRDILPFSKAIFVQSINEHMENERQVRTETNNVSK